MKNLTRHPERGVALFFSIFALLLLTGIAAALIFMANTETQVNSNYRQEQMAYFGAKAGIEEARARLMQSDPHTIYVAPGDITHPLLDTTQITQANPPSATNHMVYYIVNPGAGAATTVQPWDSSKKSTDFADDELCHDGYGASFGTAVAPDIRCDTTTLPGAATWYDSYTSTLPYSGTSSALPYKWVRIAPKMNGSVDYLTGTGSSASISTYSVNPNANVSVNGTPVAINSTTPICWDGQEEVPLTTTVGITNCSQMTSSVGAFAGAKMTNVYLVTSLGVSPTGARKMVQADVALQPTTPFPYGLFGTSTACPAISFNGNNASTDSYTTAGGQTYGTTESNTGGDVGTNGGIDIGNGNIGGIVGVLQPPPTGNGTCTAPVAIKNNGSMVGTVACPTGNSAACYVPTPYVFPTPPPPNPLPPNTTATPSTCTSTTTTTGKNGKTTTTTTTYSCFGPGTYGNISTNGALTLAPGVYNINSLTMAGNGQIIVSPPGAVTLNVGGCGDATCSSANALASPLTISGNGITDDTIPNDFTINYGGTGTVSITGNGNVTAILNAPNAPLTQKGNGNWYGSILASTISLGGNAFFHFDKNAALAPPNNGYYTMVSFREVPY